MYSFLGGVLFLIVGFVFGLIIGALLGGNFFTSFRFGGQQGYEAMGVLGAYLGGGAGLILGILLGYGQAKRRETARKI
jgi:hypothetical protein